MELFYGSGSNFSWRVQLAFELKGVPYEPRLLSFAKGDLATPEFRAVNPRGRVPALRDGAYTLYESVAILAYLDRKHPEPPLFGRTPEEAGTVWRLVCEAMNYLDGPTEAFILPLYFGRAEQEADAIRAAIPALAGEYARLEAQLERVSAAELPSPNPLPAMRGEGQGEGRAAPARATASGGWLAGTPTPSAADCVVYPQVRSVLRAASKPAAAAFTLPFLPLPPRLAAWMARIEALPFYDRTYPPHWRAAP